jgi:aldehyde:ferredoxin oxidoreductase
VPEHQENYCWLYEGVTGPAVTMDDLIYQSEKVYQFQRVFNLRLGFGTRRHDYPPYRAVGPVSTKEYESRLERYDKQLREEVGIDPSGMTTAEKIAAVRKFREDRYEQLVDAVYQRRGWTENGVPKEETVRRLGIDFPEVLELVKENGG